MRTKRVEFLDLQFDRLTRKQVTERLRAATASADYGYVVTPNVDHMVRLSRSPELRQMYEDAAICVCDSRILRALARLSGINLPLVAGSDLSAILFQEVIESGDRIAVVGTTAEFLDRLRQRFPDVEICHHAPPMGLRTNAKARREAAKFIASAKARFNFVTVGSPQQEMIAHEVREIPGAKGIALCVGAGLEFLTGDQKRAPLLLQRIHMEWAHRLATNPRRLWRRYLVEGPTIFLIYARWVMRGRRKKNWVLLCAVLLAAVGAAVIFKVADRKHGGSSAERVQSKIKLPGNALLPLELPPPDALRPLSPEEAARENAERPFVRRPDTPAAKFVFQGAAEDKERALTCLTQAVYYEAAGEGSDGQRAVAQVVLNRMRHPGYPASVCGVVYQGAERATGCQFTFTCDGSLLRAPQPALWNRARKIAEDALAGKVFGPIGHATHYHADFVLPYWADSLDKSLQLGRHIFYRLRSTLGERNAFSQRYAGAEPVIGPPNGAVVLPPSDATRQLAGALLNDELNGPAKEVEKAGQSTSSQLTADLGSGSLVIDGQTPVSTSSRRQKAAADCAKGDNKQISPLSKADMRASAASSTC